MSHRTALVALAALLAPLAAHAAAPAVMPVTGFLTDNAGAPLDGPIDLSVKLYRTPTGGPVAWSSDISVDVVDGQFTAYLGEDTALDLALFADGNAPTYLGMAVEGGAEMSPRFELGTVPYAAFAAFADSAATAGSADVAVYAESAASAEFATDADHADTCDDATKLGGLAATAYRKTSDQIEWADIDPTSVPTGLADGDDSSPAYSAGAGLSLAGTQFSADKTAIEGWARGVAYDTLTELRSALDAVYMAKQSCATDEVLASDGAGGWLCKSTTTLPLSESAVDALVNNNGYATAANLTTLSNTVTTLSTTVSGHTSSISTINSGLTDLDTRVDAIESQMSSLQSSPGNMLAAWELDDNTGSTTFVDSSGLGNNLRASNGAVGAGAVTGAHANKMVNFQGIEGMSLAAGNTMADTSQIWFETWLKSGDVTAGGGAYTIVDKQGAYKMRLTGSKMEWTVTTQGSSTACTVTHPTVLTNNTWTHVAGWYDGLSVTVSINGVPTASSCTSGRVAPTMGGVFTLGGKLTGSTWSEVFSGNLDEVHIRPTAPQQGSNWYAYQGTPSNVPVYRWNNFRTYHNGAGGWLFGNDGTMANQLLGGVQPSNWTDNNYRAAHMASSKDGLRSFLTKKGYAGTNGLIIADRLDMYSSTDGMQAVAAFRIRNTTGSNINWTPYFWATYYGGWNEWAGVAINGSEVWSSGGGNCNSAGCSHSVTITVPANRTSTVVFNSAAGYPWNHTGSYHDRWIILAFYNNSLTLPSGLVYVDDFDTMTGDWSQ